jgi:aspartate kinase
VKNVVVMKFGGTSVGSASNIERVAEIAIRQNADSAAVVVVSAMATVTNALEDASYAAAARKRAELDKAARHIKMLHESTMRELSLSSSITHSVNEKLDELHQLLESIYALGELSPRAHDLILSYGEQLSSRLVAACIAMQGSVAKAVSATELILTTNRHGAAQPLLEQSSEKALKVLQPIIKAGTIPVITGFIGATRDGVTTTLGRGGSDYSATILGYCLSANEVDIWTDVDGVMTADPRLIPEARTVTELSYSEAAELSYFGARVLHPLTMTPASLKDIPIYIKNTLHPDGENTCVSRTASPGDSPVKAITSINHASLITVQGESRIGVPDVAAKVFEALAEATIDVLFASQASSDYNISFVVHQKDDARTVELLNEALKVELSEYSIDAISLRQKLAIVAVVGDGMHANPGIAGKVLTSIGAAKINVIAIAQGSSERNISVVIDEADAGRAVQSIHDVFIGVKTDGK